MENNSKQIHLLNIMEFHSPITDHTWLRWTFYMISCMFRCHICIEKNESRFDLPIVLWSFLILIFTSHFTRASSAKIARMTFTIYDDDDDDEYMSIQNPPPPPQQQQQPTKTFVFILRTGLPFICIFFHFRIVLRSQTAQYCIQFIPETNSVEIIFHVPEQYWAVHFNWATLCWDI